MFLYNQVIAGLPEDPLLLDVDLTAQGYVRIKTAFLYPDGSNVDIFILGKEGDNFIISDLGNSLEYLMNLEGADLSLLPALNSGVHKEGGTLEIVTSNLISGVIILCHACLKATEPPGETR